MPATVARAVADALGPRVASVEEIQNLVQARLGDAGPEDVARAYVVYRQRRAALRSVAVHSGKATDGHHLTVGLGGTTCSPPRRHFALHRA